MTEEKEVEQPCQDNPESINNVAVKDIEMGEEKTREDKEALNEEEAASEAEEEDNDEETEESEDDDEQENKLQQVKVSSNDGGEDSLVEVSFEKNSDENVGSPIDAVENGKDLQMDNIVSNVDDGDLDGQVVSMPNDSVQKSPVNHEKASMRSDMDEDNGIKVDVGDSLNHHSMDDESLSRSHASASPNAQSSPSKAEEVKKEVKDGVKIGGPVDVESKNPSNLSMFDSDISGGGESGTEKEQAAFIMELHKFHKERGLDFKPPKFYGVPLNLLKLWRAVLKLGGYDKVTACKYWRQVGESFKPPKTCTTISWTFRIFYEKALLDYERYRISADGTVLPDLSVPMAAENQAPGPGRARRDAAARAMQGWHSQRVLDNGEVSDPIVKDKNSAPLSKKEKPLKSLGGILKRKKPSSPDEAVKPVPMKFPKLHSDATVIDIGSPADWVKINVRATRDCYEVYALVPGLLREEVRVQSDPAGRLVISGEPENPDNPWNVTPFKKVVSLPSRIDPHQTSAVVTLHGQLFVRVPFEHYD
ncbi:AT-rich interactive domain-containing protein 6-like [Silene latifolia]|uniref:AT-rich interactive domain-containing protein 6-like n=1 Tax=Silene latifolia TaxID=37657 RepID=UPI003D76C627